MPKISSNRDTVFCQVLNVNLSEGDMVVFEDVGHGENTMLANESILMRGLVVRSHSNQISIRFHNQRSRVGSVLLRYQGKFVLYVLHPKNKLFRNTSFFCFATFTCSRLKQTYIVLSSACYCTCTSHTPLLKRQHSLPKGQQTFRPSQLVCAQVINTLKYRNNTWITLNTQSK